jgi:ribosomal protein S18 acetylase RimI-like enzyme
MAEIQVKPMGAFDSDVRREAAAVFVEGYQKELSFFTKDEERLIDAFGQMICPDVFYLAVLEGEIVGILACSNNWKRAFKIERAVLRKSFGYIKGSIAYRLMKDEFNKPVPYPDDTGYLECAATAVRARRRGVSTALFHYVMEHTPYRRYILEVADTNENANRLYRKPGFSEMERKKEPLSKVKGFQARVYMEYEYGWANPTRFV